LLASLSHGGHSWCIHPAVLEDFARDNDKVRLELRKILLRKYTQLESPPPLSRTIIEQLGYPEPGSNDSVDFRLLSAIEADCADYLVTNDERLRKRARRISLGERVLSAAEALGAVRALF